ncbi:MAG TPA: DUF1385 domain-containing protein [Gaiellaceae bacterium]|jgi:uncharacterized protein YqhQ|nr:DUF1385 domain-containing protein [Gaiellaceae bacterium]
MAEKIRLGGMALENGVLVHGPTAWACAVRTADGSVKIAAQRKRVSGHRIKTPFLRGPARLTDAFTVLVGVKRALPEAKLPFENTTVLASMAGTALLVTGVRHSKLRDSAKELVASLLSVAPALLTVRGGSLAAYHGAEHIAIGSYEQDAPHAKEHERCGSHLVGPLAITGTVANVLATRAPERFRPIAGLAGTIGGLGATMELFGWMQRHPERRLSRALAWPGHELQHRLSTAEPSREQLEVAEAALAACLELEDA